MKFKSASVITAHTEPVLTLEEIGAKAVLWEKKFKNYRALFGTCKTTVLAKEMANFWKKELAKALKAAKK